MNLNILEFTLEDIENVLQWNKDKDKDFLKQWAGSGYTYPLTYEQIAEKLHRSQQKKSEFKIYKIIRTEKKESIIIGTVELNKVCMPRDSAMVCRFLIHPDFQNKGYGTCVLILLTKIAFKDMGYKMLRLKVFAYNQRAIRCYEKAGFILRTHVKNEIDIIDMEIKKKQ